MHVLLLATLALELVRVSIGDGAPGGRTLDLFINPSSRPRRHLHRETRMRHLRTNFLLYRTPGTYTESLTV